jgi:MSHA biogenesis protein MshM
MYLDRFGLARFPFGITPDTRFTFESRAQREVIETLLVALKMGDGFVKVTGEVGTGKTHACRHLLNALQDDSAWRVVYLPNPAVTGRALLLSLCMDLGLDVPPRASRDSMNAMLARSLLDHASWNVNVVALLDEAQAMPDEALESVRLLSNLETERSKLLRVVMFGQPELDEKLARHDLRQLNQRITFQHSLDRLAADETAAYLDHRLRVAGHSGAGLFPAVAARAIHRAANGTPRLVNVLAHKCLLLAAGDGARCVGILHVEAAVRDTPACRRPDLWERLRMRFGARTEALA